MRKLYFIIILLMSCSGNTNTQKELTNCPHINPLKITTEVVNVGQYIDSIDYIDVNTGAEYYNIDNTKKMLVLDNGDMILLMNKIERFNSSGNHIRSYGDLGKGNGEYLKIYDICLNIDKTELWALDHTNRILKYNLESGKYLTTLAPDYLDAQITGTCSGIIPSKNRGLYLISLNESKAKKINYNYSYLTSFNSKGIYDKSILQLKDFNVDYPYSPYISYSSGKYIIRPQENENICYVIENGEILPLLKIHFEEKNIEPLFLFKDNDNPWLKLSELVDNTSYKHIMNIQLTDKYMYFSTIRPNSILESFLIKKENLSGIRWLHKGENIAPIFILGSDKEFLYGIYTYSETHAKISEVDSPLINFIVKNLHNKKEGEPIILKLKFK